MKLPRFYCDTIQPGNIQLDADEAHHLIHVLRLDAGDSVELFDGKGTIAAATVTDITRAAVSLKIDDIQTYSPPGSARIIIAASIAKGQRFDWLITKCTELGADHIAPVLFDRTVKTASGPSTIQRYRKLTIAAAKQCGRIFLPKITAPAPLTDSIALLQNDYPDAQFIFGSCATSAKPIGPLTKDTAAFIGPEGGLTDAEVTLLKKHNAREVRLCDNVLRIETAAVAFAAIIQTNRKDT